MSATRTPPKTAQDPILGTVRWRPDCERTGGSLPFSREDAYFPADTEFFHRSGSRDHKGKLHSYCKACYGERRRVYLNRPLPSYLLQEQKP